MSVLERPRLRASITGHVDPDEPHWVWLYDQARITREHLRVRREVIGLLELFDGVRDLRDIQIAWMQSGGGQLVPFDALCNLVAALDDVVFLEGPRLQARYADFLRSPVRAPACVGSYEADPQALREQLDDYFRGPEGPGPIRPPVADDRFAGALIPHIDFQRGGITYAHGFKEVAERSNASLFVILGTSHYSSHRFILTRKDFATPLGVAETDKAFVDCLADRVGPSVFEDETAHLPEHSIEFHVVFLQHCLGRRPFRIVPILIGSFGDCVLNQVAPDGYADIARMIQSLERTAAECGERICYLSSGDLAHIGPKFGDAEPVSARQLRSSRSQDTALLDALAAGDRDAFARVIVQERDARRICGFPPTYLLQSVAHPARGRMLHYGQYVEPQGYESVSFASVAFER